MQTLYANLLRVKGWRLVSVAEILDDLARRLRERRRQLNMSQMDVAVMLGVTTRTYEYWEHGHTFPQPRHRQAVDEFLSGDQ